MTVPHPGVQPHQPLAKPIALGRQSGRGAGTYYWTVSSGRAGRGAIGMPSPGFREGQPERRAAGSESPSGAVAAPALLWPPLGSESAALVPKKEPKPPPNPEPGDGRGRRQEGQRERGPGRALCAGVCSPRPRASRGPAGRRGLSQPQLFVCVCLAA